ncbi:hypothetical protein LSAT2_008084, partial [Lamellibrachia satsuma]
DVCASATAQWGGLGGDVCLDSDSPKSHVLVYGSSQDITVRFTGTNSRFPRGSTFTLIASGSGVVAVLVVTVLVVAFVIQPILRRRRQSVVVPFKTEAEQRATNKDEI